MPPEDGVTCGAQGSRAAWERVKKGNRGEEALSGITPRRLQWWTWWWWRCDPPPLPTANNRRHYRHTPYCPRRAIDAGGSEVRLFACTRKLPPLRRPARCRSLSWRLATAAAARNSETCVRAALLRRNDCGWLNQYHITDTPSVLNYRSFNFLSQI